MLSRFSCVWLCVTLWTGSSVHEVLQTSILEWVSRPSSRSLPDPGIESVSLICPVLAGGFFTTSPTWETHNIFSSVSVQFSHSVMSNSLWLHESQHTRPPCPSPTPGVHSNSCPSNWWCHPAISSSVIPFSSCPQSLPASGPIPVSQLFAWGGQSIGV